MITLTLQLPEAVAAEFFSAADQLNGRFTGASPKIEAKSLMAFALARHECADICAQFDLARTGVKCMALTPYSWLVEQWLSDATGSDGCDTTICGTTAKNWQPLFAITAAHPQKKRARNASPFRQPRVSRFRYANRAKRFENA